MKIYQLHEYGGEWEDSFDYIIGSYLRKERAEEEKVKAEAKENELAERGRKCNRCPFLEHLYANLDDLIAKHSHYCSEVKLKDDEWGITCENYYSHWDESSFEIKEVEVEE